MLWETVWPFLKKLNRITLSSSSSTLRRQAKELKSGTDSYLPTHVYSNIIHNSQKIEVSTDGQINKQNGLLLHKQWNTIQSFFFLKVYLF